MAVYTEVTDEALAAFLKTVADSEAFVDIAAEASAALCAQLAAAGLPAPLFTIDPKPYEAELARAQSQLAAARSRAELATQDLTRATKLLEAKAVSRQEFDQLTSGAATSTADIRVAEAALRIAQLNLGYTRVTAPIAGHCQLPSSQGRCGTIPTRSTAAFRLALTNGADRKCCSIRRSSN